MGEMHGIGIGNSLADFKRFAEETAAIVWGGQTWKQMVGNI